MKRYLVHSALRHDGISYDNGDFIDESVLDEQSAKRLLFLNVISKVTIDKEETVVIVNNATGAVIDDDEEPIEVTIDINFEHKELVEIAKDELHLEFRRNISKKALIEQIIEQGHAQYFLDQLEN